MIDDAEAVTWAQTFGVDLTQVHRHHVGTFESCVSQSKLRGKEEAMARDLDDRTVFPPTEPHEDFDALVALLGRDQRPELVGPDGHRLALPVELFEVLRDVVAALARGSAITVAPHDTTLTTQQAADLLGVSRPTLIALLERGDIPFTRPGHHRRVLLEHVLDHRRRAQHARREALDELTSMAEDDDLYRDNITSARLRR